MHTGDTYEVADLALAAAGGRRIAWAERAMPALSSVRARFVAERPLDGQRVAACLQVTAETAVLLSTLVAGGAQVRLAASNPLSTQDDTAAALVADHGVGVYARSGVDTETYRRHLSGALDLAPTLVIDEGGDLVNTLHTDRADLAAAVRAGCESTASGVLRARQMHREGVLRFPMVAVDATPTRRLVDNRYGTGQSTVDGIVRATNLLLAGRTVVVAGYGQCGTGIAERARGLGARVLVTEVDPLRALDATLQGYQVLPMAQAARCGEVFVTATGNRDVLRAEHFEVMPDGAVLANAGHFDVEIDIPALADLAVERRIGERAYVDEYVLADGRRLQLLAEGRVVNLTAAEGNPPSVMDLAFAGQALTAAWLATGELLPTGVHPVPAELDRQVADLRLAASDIHLDTLTDSQRAYLSSWRSADPG
ncbi:adenosylhomocysteinase [Actinocatenispora thailandica]|uniref:Adenosylhomocysteinase n=1 Tax=Actinocatenispora thailandica TaxID=227318 RepID=A0A7R7DRD2_9ACTN|nr:adenosylhomocysteinase [Actinocatenispora thailandica]BCJ36326.1 adenosylhomocysteinase [Actinocatenispora thailandica]